MSLKIKVTDGTFDISWEVTRNDPDVTTITQVDSLGTYPLDFRSEHDAVTWMLDRADYAVNNMGFNYTLDS